LRPGARRGLEGPYGPVLEAREEGRGVVHGHRSPAVTTRLQRTLPDEGLGGPDHLLYGSNQVVRQVDEVGPQVSQGPRAGDLLVKAPDQGELRVEDEVL
jgi:hypothetical protein